MIRNTSYENNLFEQILRMKSLMTESKGYGDLIMEGPITGFFKSVVDALGEIVKAGKISDSLLNDAAVAVGKMTDEATAVMKFQTFYKKVVDSGQGVIINQLVGEIMKTMSPDSLKNIDNLEKSFVADAVSNGSVNNSLLDSLRATIRKNIKLPDSLLDLQNVIESRIITRIREAADDALDVGTTAGTTATRTASILDTTVDDILRNANRELKNEVPPRKLTKEMLEDIGRGIDLIEAEYKSGKITADQIFEVFKREGQIIVTNIEKFEKIIPNIRKIWDPIWNAVTSGVVGFLKFFKNNWKYIFGGGFVILLLGYISYGTYTKEFNPLNFFGKGKSEKCFGDSSVIECLNDISGYNTLDVSQIDLLCNLKEIPQNEGVGRLSCDNINELAKPEIKVKSITFKAADGVGKVDKF